MHGRIVLQSGNGMDGWDAVPLVSCRLLWNKLDHAGASEKRLRLVEIIKNCVRDKKAGDGLMWTDCGQEHMLMR